MKGAIYAILAVLFCALQTTVFEYLPFFSVRPNLLLGLVVCAALIGGAAEGGMVGFLCGILADVMGYGAFGVNTLMMMYTGVLLGISSRNFYRIRNVVAFSFAFVMNFIYSFLFYFFTYYIWGQGGFWLAIGRKILPESLYTAALSVLIILILRFANRRLSEKEA